MSSQSQLARLVAAACMLAAVPHPAPLYVDITWMSITNMYYEVGPLRIVTDGYISRIPQLVFHGGGSGIAYTTTPQVPDVAAVRRVLDALGGAGSVNLLLSGHSHFDHSFDTGTWSTLTGARIIGPRTTCYQVIAQQVPRDRCTAVNGGEVLHLADGVTVRVVRWNHSGDSAVNPDQHDPVELNSVPRANPVTGGLRVGLAEDFPNGGGSRAFLFTVDTPDGRLSWFFQNTASAVDLTRPIVVGGIDYGAPLENLKAAMRDAGLSSVDLWIGSAGTPVAQLVVPVLHPKAFMPVHWDGLYGAFEAGVAKPWSDPSLQDYLTRAGVKLVVPEQYMDKWRLDRDGLRPLDNAAVKRALGFSAK